MRAEEKFAKQDKLNFMECMKQNKSLFKIDNNLIILHTEDNF